jgi:hypothetical protein
MQSSFYQSALRSAEREAEKMQAQQHALEQADRAAASELHQAPSTVMLPSSPTAEISFYQSALWSAEREAAQLQAQRDALEQADRAFALLVQQAPPTVMRPSPATAADG